MASGKNRSRDRSLNDRVDRMKWEIVLETINLKSEFVISHKNCTDLSKLQFWPIYIIFHTYILFHVIYIWISLIQVRETILQLPIILARRLITKLDCQKNRRMPYVITIRENIFLCFVEFARGGQSGVHWRLRERNAHRLIQSDRRK